MKKIVLAASAAAVLMGVAIAWAGEGQPAAAPAVRKQVRCPIMGGPVNTNVFADAEGKRVYFCCSACIGEFKKDPAKVIKQIEAEGVTLDQAAPAKEAIPAAPAKTEPTKTHAQP